VCLALHIPSTMALRNLAQPLLRCGLRIAAEPSLLCGESRVATAGWMAVWRSYATGGGLHPALAPVCAIIPSVAERKIHKMTVCRAVEEGLKYAKSHEWAKLDGDTITVGISDFAQVAPAPPPTSGIPLTQRSLPRPLLVPLPRLANTYDGPTLTRFLPRIVA